MPGHGGGGRRRRGVSRTQEGGEGAVSGTQWGGEVSQDTEVGELFPGRGGEKRGSEDTEVGFWDQEASEISQ